MNRHKHFFTMLVRISIALTVLTVIGCGDVQKLLTATPTPTSKTTSTLVMNFSGLQPLANNYHYEGWAIINNQPLPTGKFNVDSSGKLVNLSGQVVPNGVFNTGIDLSGASAIVITIEPSGDTDTKPTDTHYLAGAVLDGVASLTVGSAPALGNDFRDASGKYILATPTDGPNTNEKSGVWFLDLSSGSPAVGLRLPTLPAGWEYEGWAVINGKPLTTGRFTSGNGADKSAPYSGPQPGPPFPGEDYLVNAPSGLKFPTDLSNGTVVISIEPSPDDTPAPFTLKPLVGTIPANAIDHTTYSMNNQAAGFPTGIAVIK